VIRAIAIAGALGGTAAAEPLDSDLAVLGAELTPRKYAAPRERTVLDVSGYLRARSEALYDLDLDRGLDPTGQPLYPVPLGGGQWLDGGDLRLRTDVAFYARGTGVSVKARLDWLDNAHVGSAPDGPTPSTSTGQQPTVVVLKRAWGEVLTPLGVLAAGRIGAHFGLGMVAHGGDCADCDGGDAADRIAFVAPLGGHLFAAAYDFTASGPTTPRRAGNRVVDLEPSDDVSTATLAVLRAAVPATRARRAAAGRSTLEYGVYATHRRQDRDVPASYLPASPAPMIGPGDLVARDFTATSSGIWLRLSSAAMRVEAEAVFARARIGQPSLIPGVELTQEATSTQYGVAVETEVAATSSVRAGLDGGLASGDDAPGFGAFPVPGAAETPAGALDGPQASFPADTTVDNFRFHPDYHVDQILFREIVGTVTDAIYVRPHATATLLDVGHGQLDVALAAIASWAMQPTSTPSGSRHLGVEIDPSLRWQSRDGFVAALDHAVLFPGAAFDGATMTARTAHAIKLRLGYVF
jgi:uncharacterized protein (TIGR04551 family)